MYEQLFHKAVHMVNLVTQNLKTEHLALPTPCSQWNVRELLQHMVNELAWVPPLLQGRTIEEVGSTLDGDLLGSDPLAAWRGHALAAVEAASVVSPDAIVHLSYGDKSARAYLDEVGGDLIIHGWDLSMALSVPYVIDDATADQVGKATFNIMPEAKATGMIATDLPVDEHATPAEKLLAHFGRNVHWNV